MQEGGFTIIQKEITCTSRLVTFAGGTFPAAVIWPVKNLPKLLAARTTALYLQCKNLVNHNLFHPLLFNKFTFSVPSNVSHGAKGIITLCNGHSGHLVHGQHRALPLWQLLHQLWVLRWVDKAHQGGFRLQEVHFTQTWSSNLQGRQMFQKKIKLVRRDAYQPWGPGLSQRLPWRQ